MTSCARPTNLWTTFWKMAYAEHEENPSLTQLEVYEQMFLAAKQHMGYVTPEAQP